MGRYGIGKSFEDFPDAPVSERFIEAHERS